MLLLLEKLIKSYKLDLSKIKILKKKEFSKNIKLLNIKIGILTSMFRQHYKLITYCSGNIKFKNYFVDFITKELKIKDAIKYVKNPLFIGIIISNYRAEEKLRESILKKTQNNEYSDTPVKYALS